MTDDELKAIEARLALPLAEPTTTEAQVAAELATETILNTDVPALTQEVRRLRALCAEAYERVRFLDDKNVGGDGWQSDELQTLVAALGTIARNEDDVM